jgi:adenosylcobinamide amidohydrolase
MAKQDILKIIEPIRSAQSLLIQAGRNSTDPVAIMKISMEYSQLDSYLSQLLHTQTIQDDIDFVNATAALKAQASTLQIEEDNIKVIISDVSLASKIIGYISEAVVLAMKYL